MLNIKNTKLGSQERKRKETGFVEENLPVSMLDQYRDS